MKIYHRHQLMQCHDMAFLIERIERGFSDYSQGKVNMPPVCHMHFDEPPGDLHVKCASTLKSEYYVVKIASYFPQNPQQDIPSIQGMVFLFSQSTGKPVALFLDDGYLTHLRTAIAGAVCAKYLCAKDPGAIGIIGAGTQARCQLELLSHVIGCREVWIWAPQMNEMQRYQADERLQDFVIHLAESPKEVAHNCRLIVTTTPSSTPLLYASDIARGTHITAVGSDRPGKQELDPAILGLADRVVVDSRIQCLNYGETHCALKAGTLSQKRIEEIGEIISGQREKRISDDQITIADLTGLGIQDLEIATAFHEFFEKEST